MSDVENAKGAVEEASSRNTMTETTRIVAVISAYWAISMSLVFVNKAILSGDHSYPLTMTWYQFFIAIVCVLALGQLGQVWALFSFLPAPEFQPKVAVQVLPVSCVFVAMIVCNNLCLQFVEVSFYQVARSLTILFTILFTYLILSQKTAPAAMVACAVVVIGFSIGSIGEARLSLAGLAFGLTSSVFISLYGIYVKKIMHVLDGNQWRLLLYNAIISAILLLPLIVLSGEVGDLVESGELERTETWVTNTIAGLLGFALNIAVFLQIKYTSPLTNNICGTLKATTQTLLAIYIYRNPVTFMNGLGISLVIAGSGAYSYVRYLQMQQR